MNNEERRQPQVFGYIRISDPTQKINRQADFMKELAIDEKNIFIDKQSGKDFNRPAYKKLLRKLRAGDTLYIKELDRLGRNKIEIKEELHKLRSKKIRVKITNIPTTMLDFQDSDWILDMVTNIMVEVLSAVAEQERETNHQRQAEGIAAARARGIHLGRPHLQLPENFPYYYELWKTKKKPRAIILEELQLDSVKFYSYVRSYENKLKKSQQKNQS